MQLPQSRLCRIASGTKQSNFFSFFSHQKLQSNSVRPKANLQNTQHCALQYRRGADSIWAPFFASLLETGPLFNISNLEVFIECDKPDRAGELKFSETKVNCFHTLEHLRKGIKTQMYNRSSFPYTVSTERLSQLVT